MELVFARLPDCRFAPQEVLLEKENLLPDYGGLGINLETAGLGFNPATGAFLQ